MKSAGKYSRLQITFWLWLLILVGFPLASPGEAQRGPSLQNGQRHGSADAGRTIPALLVSDIHFDPFHDPAKVRQLVNAPVSRWGSILSAAPSLHQQEAFAVLQQRCDARGVDTPYALLRSSLRAMRSFQPDAKFMMLGGDLLAHAFSCRYATLFPAARQGEYQAFVMKTLSFVMGELRAGFPGVPIYVALGNNDSACGDYRLDAGSEFLLRAGKILAEDLPPSQQRRALDEFAKGGYYSLTMGAPMRDTRLIVINDVFLSPRYSTCDGKPDSAAATAEMAWLQTQLAQAQRLGQRIWIMGHIPPGVNPYATAAKRINICGKEMPDMFLSSDKLADLLIEHAGVIRLAIFAHTHMDEIRLLEPAGRSPQTSSKHGVAVKIVPSISPVDGNNPSFTIAHVNRATAVLQDYEVIAASDQTGIATTWSKEYDYEQAYDEAQFSPHAVKQMIREFEDDPGAKTKASQEYIRNYYVGDRSSGLPTFWSQYVCALANYSAKAFANCACTAAK